MVQFIILLSSLFFITSCASSTDSSQSLPVSSPSEWIAASVDFHGGTAYDTARIRFVFRDREYEGTWNRGAYLFSRRFEQDSQLVEDLLSNESFERMINGQSIEVPDTMAAKYSSSVNSVWYFAMLPYRLLDPAVQTKGLGESTLREKTYQKIEVTFASEGGGEDFEDVFVYWFDKEDYSLDYLAYSYAEDHGLGLRFREAINPRRVGGILWQDYVNYKADPTLYEVHQLDAAFNEGKLDTLSLIELEEVKVE